jgi:hypothetical protein
MSTVTPRVSLFLNHIISLLKPDNEDHLRSELERLWHSFPEDEEKCSYLMKSGKKKGMPCGKVNCSTHKKEHNEKEENKQKEVKHCPFTLKTGARKGQACDKTCADKEFCQTHSKMMTIQEQKEKKETDSVKEVKEKSTCSSVIASGKRKGEICGKPCTENRCKTHAKDKKEKEVTSKKTEPKPKRCTALRKSDNKICGNPCEEGKESCSTHDIIRIKKHGSLHIIKDTNVLFDMSSESAIGYLDDGKAVYKQNDEVRSICDRYAILFLSK